ncbi:hypothetical protein M0R45_014455 [Rubus argutus]|uniref:Pentatricopeptide repeat-containing protein n=1 Tax=Rubus argutus TaxID=59490 RepID=A0AAW1XP54_RUBAR
MILRSTKLLNHPIRQSLTHSTLIKNPSCSSSEIPKRLHHKDWLSPNEVVQVFTSLQDPNSVLTALDHYSKRKDYKPNEALYTLLIDKLAQAHLFEAVDDVMDRIKAERNCRLSDDFFRGVMKAYGNVGGRIKKAIQTLYDMPSFGCWPTVKTFNFALHLLVSTKMFDVVHEVYLVAPKLGIEIDACCLNIIIKGLCESGKWDNALKVLDEFPKQKCEPNALTFSTLMHGLCVNGKVDDAFGLLKRMENEGIDPDTITFNILIAGLRKQRRYDEGIKLLEQMKLKGCAPNPASYQEVLYCLLDAQRFAEAKQFMIRMISKRASPSFVSYKTLIQGLCKENMVEDLDWVLRQMIRQGFIPKMGMWKQIIRSVFSKSNHCCVSYEETIDDLIT